MLFFILLQLLLFKNTFASSKDIEISFIADFLDIEFHTIRVNAFLCWEKSKILYLFQNEW